MYHTLQHTLVRKPLVCLSAADVSLSERRRWILSQQADTFPVFVCFAHGLLWCFPFQYLAPTQTRAVTHTRTLTLGCARVFGVSIISFMLHRPLLSRAPPDNSATETPANAVSSNLNVPFPRVIFNYASVDFALHGGGGQC